MLIRSQDKEMIVNVDAINHILVDEAYRLNGSLYDVCADGMRLGYYSTKAKAIKVLDMIQKRYSDYQTTHTVSNGLATISLFVDCSDEINELYMKVQNALGKTVVFQIPEDSEVEV